MIEAEISGNEDERLRALSNYKILDTAPEQAYDDITNLASHICQCPISLVSLVDETRQWFKSHTGLDETETPRRQAFCSHAILSDEVFEIPDALEDRRFFDNPLVSAPPNIRFYAGSPLLSLGGIKIGTLCVIDRTPRHLNPAQRAALQALSRQVVHLLELRETAAQLAAALQNVKTLEGLLPICSHCKEIRNSAGTWESIESYLRTNCDADFTHGICPDCITEHFPETANRLREASTAIASSK